MTVSLFEYEVNPDGDMPDGGVPDGGVEVGAGEPVAEARAGLEDGGGSAPAWTPDDPAFLEAVDSRAMLVAESMLQQLLQQNAGAEETDQASPYVDEYGNEDPRFTALRDELLGPIQAINQRFEQQAAMEQQQAGNEEIQTMLEDDIKANGEFLSPSLKDQVEPFAEMMWSRVQNRYPGGTPYGEAMRANEAVKTFQKAISTFRQIEREIKSAGNEQYKNELETIAGAGPESGHTGGVVGLVGGEKPTSMEQIAERIIARRSA